jgi:hypothetical protein
MNPLKAAANAASWRADWAWSLPLIVLTVVIHVFGLGFLHERVVRAVGRIVDRRDFTLLFGAVMGIAVLLVTVLHAIEGMVLGGSILAARRAPRCPIVGTLFVWRDDDLWRQRSRSAGPLAAKGRARGAKLGSFCSG